ncbi:MAG: ABC transporter ATP-binding protein [Candidatus Rokubacteria bacterium]|nr:ABC transporter ATP-binding protein [Candidatus Rokubacteria bacterium]
MTRAPVADFRRVTFGYSRVEGRRRAFAITDVSFDVRPGEILGVIGPNSAGKTTILRLLTGVLEPAAGEVRIEDVPLARLGSVEIARRVAVVPQTLPEAFPFTVGELVLMGRYPHGPGRLFESEEDREVARRVMEETGLLELAGVAFARLSGGERQRAVIARALAQRPRLLALDEPTTHLDLRYQAQCAELVQRLSREDGVGVLLISHDMNLAAELCDRLLLLAEGQLLALGPPEEVLDPGLLGTAFGCAVVVERSRTTGCPVVRAAWSNTVVERG